MVSRMGRPAENVTAAYRAVNLVVVATGAMLATSRMADWREEGSTVMASLLLFSCIPVSLSVKEGEGGEEGGLGRGRRRGRVREREEKREG